MTNEETIYNNNVMRMGETIDDLKDAIRNGNQVKVILYAQALVSNWSWLRERFDWEDNKP